MTAGLPVSDDVGRLAAEQRHQLVAHDARDFLRRRELLRDLRPDRALLDLLGEVADDGQGHVGLEQGEPDLPEGLLEVVVGQVAFAPKLLEDTLHPLRQTFEHRVTSVSADRRDGAERPRVAE